MLQSDSKAITRKWAVALIVLNLLRISTPFIVYFQTKYQLVSPLIPKNVVVDIIAPYMVIGLVSVFLTIAAFIFYVYSKFTFTIIICALNLIFVQLYFLFHPGSN
jgi:hypothetical protein